MPSARRIAVGVDLGGTKIACGLVDSHGGIVETVTEKTRGKDGFQAVVEQIVNLVKSLAPEGQRLDFVGVGAAGQVDPFTGALRHAPNLGWTDAPLGAELIERLGCPVKIDNDVRVATIGEYLFGLPRRPESFYNVYAGTGVGSGFVFGGRLLQGVSNSACEIGHHSIAYDGLPCSCGNRGCLELYCSGLAITRMARDELDNGAESALLDEEGRIPADLDTKAIGKAAREGDGLARRVVEEGARLLGVGLANIVNLFNPEVLMVGGGLVGLGEGYTAAVARSARERAIRAAMERTELVFSHLGTRAAIIGAAFLHRVGPGGYVCQGEEGA